MKCTACGKELDVFYTSDENDNPICKPCLIDSLMNMDYADYLTSRVDSLMKLSADRIITTIHL